MKEFSEYLKKNSITFATCESCTGGLFASMLCEYSGISSIYKGSFVTYQNEIKVHVVGVKQESIDTYGVVSEQVAKEMALQTQNIMGVDLCISFTGNAGPDVCDNKPVGRVYCGVAYKGEVTCFEFQLNGSRNEIRHEVILESLKKIKIFLGI